MSKRSAYNSFLVFLFIISITIFTSCRNKVDNPPIPGDNGAVELTDVQSYKVTLGWERATDDNTHAQYLEYKAVFSLKDNIGTLDLAETNGIPIWEKTGDEDQDANPVFWHQASSTITATDLQDGLLYYFNVIVRDEYWNRSVYQTSAVQTLDVTPPVPGDRGLLVIKNEALNEALNTVSLDLEWLKATDNNYKGAEILQYKVLYSDQFSLSNAETAEDNDLTPADKKVWQTDVDTFHVDGLKNKDDDGNVICYYFNVIVKDEYPFDNKSLYQTISQKPTPGDNGILEIIEEQANGVKLRWTRATDSENDANQIQYAVFESKVKDDVDDLETLKGDVQDTDWKPYYDITPDPKSEDNYDTTTITPLDEDSIYYFNVLIKDVSGVMAIYTLISNAPTPGGGGSLTIKTKSSSSVTLKWEKAEDGGNDPEDLAYKIVRSEDSDSVRSVWNIENDYKDIDLNGLLDNEEDLDSDGELDIAEDLDSDGKRDLNPSVKTIVTDWTYDINTVDILGLDEATTYYFNVIVKDPYGHKSVYKEVMSNEAERSATGRSLLAIPPLSSTLPSEEVTTDKNTYDLEISNTAGALATEQMEFPQDQNVIWEQARVLLDARNVGLMEELSSNGTIQIWPGQDSNTTYAFQYEEAYQPTLALAEGDDTLDGVVFEPERMQHLFVDLSDDEVDRMTDSTGYTVFVVASLESGSSTIAVDNCLFQAVDESGLGQMAVCAHSGNDGTVRFYIVSDDDVKTDFTNNALVPCGSGFVLTVSLDSTSSQMGGLYMNGNKEGALSFQAWPKPISKIILGALQDSKTGNITTSLNGRIASFILLPTFLSEDEIHTLSADLMENWGIISTN